jgi:hypothetical protein
MARPINSSISASDGREWRRWLWRYAGSAVALFVAVAAMLLALDPYDTGRFALVPRRGVPDFGQRLSFASIARQPGIDVAIIGNSTIQLLDPARLTALTGEETVSLAIPGTGPREQLAVADWFRRHHRNRPFRLVFGLDASWCTTARPIPLGNPFPFWLYSKSRLDYTLNMMQYKSFEAAWRKLKLLFGKARAARPDGYHDYDSGHLWRSPDFGPPDAGAEPAAAPGDFTAPPLLRRFLAGLPAGTRVVLVFPPRYASALPPPGTSGALREANCKRAYDGIAATYHDARILDFLHDDGLSRDGQNFWDKIHYRKNVARMIENRVAAALAPGKTPSLVGQN